jgi:zinc transport system permease protein
MITDIFKYQFLQNAMLASIFASIVCGIIGVLIVEKKLVMMSGGIAHTSYGGVGLGYLLGFEPIIGAFGMSICAALGIAYIKRKSGTQSDLIIGLFWSFGMALGILFIALMPGYPPDISSYLFGSILSVTKSNLYLISGFSILIVFIVSALFEYFKTYIFDEEFAKILGVKTTFLEYLLFVLIAIAVVVIIRVVGIILVLALITAPTAISCLISKSLKSRMILAIIIGNILCLSGLIISYVFNIPSGATIVVLSTFSYFLVYILSLIKRKKLKKNEMGEIC